MASSKYFALSLALLTSVASAEVIFSENFETESPEGTAPYKASTLRPKHNEAGKAVVIVGEAYNIAGTGKAVYLQDRMGNSEDSISLEYDFVDSTDSEVSALRIDFGFSSAGMKEKKKDKLYFGAGEYSGENSSKMNATARRFLQIEFLDNDQIKFNTDSGKDKTVKINSAAKNKISLFANDYDNKAIQYPHPTTGESTTLKANQVAYYLNGELAHETSLDLDDTTAEGTVSTTENNFGRLGFYSSTKSDNNAWVFDDIVVTKL
ncbi:MAG: hypothetical protein ACSHX8_15255 [Opitutaceae bacterium]